MTQLVMKLMALTAVCALAMFYCPTNANPAVTNEVQRRDQQNFQILFHEENEKEDEEMVVYADSASTPEGTTESNSGSSEGYTGSTEENEGSSDLPSTPPTTAKPSGGAQSQWLSFCVAPLIFLAFILHL